MTTLQVIPKFSKLLPYSEFPFHSIRLLTVFSRIFIRSLNARIESRENWTPVKNGRLDWVAAIIWFFSRNSGNSRFKGSHLGNIVIFEFSGNFPRKSPYQLPPFRNWMECAPVRSEKYLSDRIIDLISLSNRGFYFLNLFFYSSCSSWPKVATTVQPSIKGQPRAA